MEQQTGSFVNYSFEVEFFGIREGFGGSCMISHGRILAPGFLGAVVGHRKDALALFPHVDPQDMVISREDS